MLDNEIRRQSRIIDIEKKSVRQMTKHIWMENKRNDDILKQSKT
jgi:hypothetical protein